MGRPVPLQSDHLGYLTMFGIGAIVAFALALIFHLASVSGGKLTDALTWAIAGLLCLSVHVVTGWWPARHG